MYINNHEYYEKILNNIDINETVRNCRETYVGVWKNESYSKISSCDSITISIFENYEEDMHKLWKYYFDIYVDCIICKTGTLELYTLFKNTNYTDELIFQTSLQYDISEDFLRFLINTQKRINK